MQSAVHLIGPAAPAVAMQHRHVSGEKLPETRSITKCCKPEMGCRLGAWGPGPQRSWHRAVKSNRRSLPLSGRIKATSDVTAVKAGMQPATLYDVLGVSKEASTDEIHAAYKARKKQINESVGSETEQPLETLEAAYDELREPESRRIYDFQLANQGAGDARFVWPYEVDVTQRITAEGEQNFKDTADPTLLQGFDNELSDDEQFDLTSDLLILGVVLSVVISAVLKLSGIGFNNIEALGENAVEMWEKLGPSS